MERRTAVLAGLAVSGWAAFFASLALRPGGESASVEPESRVVANAEATLQAGSDEAASTDAPSPIESKRETVESETDAGTSTVSEADRFEESIARVLDQNEAGSPCYSLKRLGGLEDERLKEMLLAWFADSEFCVGTHRSRLFAEALAPYDDPRIAPIAERLLNECIENGLEHEAAGYVELLATKGGERGRRLVVELLHRERGHVRMMAASQVGAMRDPALLPDLLDAVKANPVVAYDVFQGLAAWEHEPSHAALRGLVDELGPDADPDVERTRHWAMRAYGAGLTASELDRELADYWTIEDAAEERLRLECLHGAAEGSDLPDSLLLAKSFPVVRDALGSGDAELVQQALNLIEYNSQFWTDDYLALVEARANDPTLDEDDRRDARAVLIEARRGG